MAKKSKKSEKLVEQPQLLYDEQSARWQDVPSEPETFNTFTDVLKWIDSINMRIAEEDSLIDPIDLLNMIGTRADVDGYMVSPTSLYEGNTLIAKSQGVVSIDEFSDTVNHIHQIGKRVFLYCACRTDSSEWPIKVRYAIL